MYYSFRSLMILCMYDQILYYVTTCSTHLFILYRLSLPRKILHLPEKKLLPTRYLKQNKK